MTGLSSPPTGREIAERAQQLKIAHLALMLTLPSILDPDLPVLRTELARAGLPASGDLPMGVYYGTDQPGDEALTFSTREILTKAARLRGDIVREDLLSISMIHGAIRLGDMIKTGGHEQASESLLEFARHYRNACAHGDRWHFLGAAPAAPAACRHLTLTSALHGTRATFVTVSPRLHIEFLDDLTNFFLPGAVSPYPRQA